MTLIKDKIYYTYNDITIMPCVISDIEHRSECNPFDGNDNLPLFTAPMDTVVDKDNFKLFEENKIYPILPRTESLNDRVKYSIHGKWAAYSLNEFSDVFCNHMDKLSTDNEIKALIDVANGHMRKIIDLVTVAKEIYGNKLIIMAGNIANPNTYEEYAKCGIDYCRVGIGGGCFIGDTEITLSDNSKKKIKDVEIGDKVKTINGDFNVVDKKEEKTNSLVTINGSITCTPNHKFLVINKDEKEKINKDNINKYAYYIEVKELDKNKHLLVKMF